jgi:hypothetical protein
MMWFTLHYTLGLLIKYSSGTINYIMTINLIIIILFITFVVHWLITKEPYYYLLDGQ